MESNANSDDVKPFSDSETQCDFKSKESSFFVMKKCYSDNESETEELLEERSTKRTGESSISDVKPKVECGIDIPGPGQDGEKNNEISDENNKDDKFEKKDDVKGNNPNENKIDSGIDVSCDLVKSVDPVESNEECNLIGECVQESSQDEDEKDPNSKVADKEVCLVGKQLPEKRKVQEDTDHVNRELKKAKLETKALKAKRPGFTDERYNETSYYIENGLRKVYPYYFTFTTFTKGRWVGEKILDVFAREFRAHPPQEYERCIRSGTLTVNYERVDVDYRLKHNDLLANVVHRHETPVLAKSLKVIYIDEDLVVLDKPCSLPVHPCGRYRHNTVVFILAKEYQLKNLRTIHRLDRLTSGLLLFGRTPKKARQMEQQIRNRMVSKEYVCRVDGHFPSEVVHCSEPIEVVSYKIGVCKVSAKGKECTTTFHKLGYNPNTNTSVVLCQPHTGRMHQIRVHLQYLGYPVVNDPLYNHEVFGPERGRGGHIGKTDEELIRDLIGIHNAENWLGMDGDSDVDPFKPPSAADIEDIENKGGSREASPCEASTPPAEPPLDKKVTVATQTGHESADLVFHTDKMTTDPHCYECKVRYRDPKPRDLVMYLHAFKYQGPGWSYQTEFPDWARVDWTESSD